MFIYTLSVAILLDHAKDVQNVGFENDIISRSTVTTKRYG